MQTQQFPVKLNKAATNYVATLERLGFVVKSHTRVAGGFSPRHNVFNTTGANIGPVDMLTCDLGMFAAGAAAGAQLHKV